MVSFYIIRTPHVVSSQSRAAHRTHETAPEMDLLLELPLDAIVSRLQSLPAVVGLLSTWMAVLAAALGLWRIRAVGSSKSCSAVPAATFAGLSSPPTELAASEPELPQGPKASSEDQKDCDELTMPSRCVVTEGGATTKTRFTYFESSQAEGDDGDKDVGCNTFEIADLCCGFEEAAPWSGDWSSSEDAMMARMGDLGWYRYQDRTALSGSVVRLWDGGRDRGLLATRRRRIAW